ncbi:hypothetical protein A2210_00530 [Candidatus Woesebacteria bacterium RIFOXYA1_FULL_40_18]|uniref:UDP-N-acetylglucosamine 2-epimerase domain-containing protein n=1 Tax=Candidatus Woesebacteria bacterium RIFOXYA1_FULL_40_18 TaxID=1802532 RepID=A0A1F8CKK5_9BACT|nr:MAG: hypothetical protein A2210_00530 [Candidatus Woesebacteria bacterium RIFOXYA1_FULL_40_18]
MKKRIYFFIGTTAELIKLAPIIREFKKREIDFKVITSGQTHVLFDNLTGYTGKVIPDIKFEEKTPRSSLLLFGWWLIRTFLSALISLRKEFKGLNKKNSYFIIHGDTVSSLMGAFIAYVYGLRIVHVESGLRSFNFLEPFPEEICRYIIIHLADVLFAPTQWAFENLKGLSGIKINTSQNTLIETCQWALRARKLPRIIKKHKKYYILTMHRQEHVIFKKSWTVATIKYVIRNAPKSFNCILVAHHLARSFFGNSEPIGQMWKRVEVTKTLPYIDFMKLMENAEFIATDGCTNQEEAYYMGVPLLALRNHTERIEGLGENIVISKSKKTVIKNFLKNYKKYKRKAVNYKTRPSKIIVDFLTSNSTL